MTTSHDTRTAEADTLRADRPLALTGLHHVTAIAGDPRVNLAFYSEVLGQRLVKKTVNFDDPTTYHLYYGDEAGSPGTILTFFPWPGARRGSHGAGMTRDTAYAVPPGSLDYWHDRLRSHRVVVEEPKERFGEGTLLALDPDGLRLELIETAGCEAHSAWPGATGAEVPERYALRGFRGVTLATAEGGGTETFLTDVMGFEKVAGEGARSRFRIGPDASDAGDFTPGTTLDVVTVPERAGGGAGTVHHIAFRIADDPHELEWREYLVERGQHVSPVMDRQYFHSIYFREPGGVLFEIATDPPGFTADESLETLGGELKLPSFLEGIRAHIEEALPDLEETAA